MPFQLGIVAATLTGNRGAEAMLLSVVAQALARHPEAQIHVLSYSPDEDQRWLQQAGGRFPQNQVFVHSSTPLRLVVDWLFWGLLLLLRPSLKQSLASTHGQSFRSLCRLNAVVDLAGVSFMDARLKFLPFNVLSVWPFLWHGVPVLKLSQAMGPFKHFLNRFLAKRVLTAMKLVVARGAKTAAHLGDLGLQGWIQAPDTAFTLSYSPRYANFEQRPERILVMPSSLMHKKHPAYLEQLMRTVHGLRDQGLQVDLMAHSWKEDTAKLRNNDWPLCMDIHAFLGQPADVQLWGPGLDAIALKEIISAYRLVLTSRFHGMVAALDTQTPVWVLGWSHKYREILSEFALEGHALPFEAQTTEGLVGIVKSGLAGSGTISQGIAAALPDIRRRAQAQFDGLWDCL